METTSICINEINRDWFIVDAENQILGRFASEIAQILRGKKKPFFTPQMDMGDFVIDINAEKIKVTGTDQKEIIAPESKKEVLKKELQKKKK